MNKPTLAHVLACLLFSLGSIVTFLTANPTLAGQLHVTATILQVAGFLVALASMQLFGASAPSKPAPVFVDPPAPAQLSNDGGRRGFTDVGLIASFVVLCIAVGAASLLVECQLFNGKTVPPVTAAASCVLDDAAKGAPIAQIVTDCGGDVAQVVAVLVDQANAPSAAPTAAYGEAVRLRLVLGSFTPMVVK